MAGLVHRKPAATGTSMTSQVLRTAIKKCTVVKLHNLFFECFSLKHFAVWVAHLVKYLLHCFFFFRCQAMERLVQLVIQEEDMDTEVISLLGSCLCAVLKEQLEGKVFPEEVNDE